MKPVYFGNVGYCIMSTKRVLYICARKVLRNNGGVKLNERQRHRGKIKCFKG